MKKKLFLILITLIITGCSIPKSNFNIDKEGKIIVFKKLLICKTEKKANLFFENSNCIATYNFFNPSIKEFIKHFNNDSIFFEKDYAFIFLNKKVLDTLFVNRELNSYMLRHKNQSTYYILNDTLNIPFLNVIKNDNMNLFFSECW